MAFFTKLHGIARLLVLLLLLLSFASLTRADTKQSETNPTPQCAKLHGGCHDKRQALKLKLIAISSILLTSMIGVCLPLFSNAVPALRPDKDLFVLVKAFASGVILATGYMHVLPDSFDCLRSECLPEYPWRKFPFTTFAAMLSALATLMLDSFSMSFYKRRFPDEANHHRNVELIRSEELESSVEHADKKIEKGVDEKGLLMQLLRHRVVAQVYI